ncbi:MAG: prolyl endopeptidase, partial [Candidatus Eremiobacteraeota bacterium]|nr:prolyl endopeptidase [Candidatus Eremiobacteraeota bacterium]
MPLPYPDAPRVDQIDEYFGTRVADPYRWLEEVDSDRTKRWIAEENQLAESFLSTVPNRSAIRSRLTDVWDYERRSVPEKAGALYAYFRNTGLQNQAVLYVTRDLAEPGRVLLDPNTLSPDGTVALSGVQFSDDGSRLAYSISSSGSDWQEWHVRDVATGADLPDIVRWSKFSGASWKRDGSGFYYSRYDEPASESKFKDANYFHKVYFHRLGTPQSTDVLVYERPDHKDWNFAGFTTEDGRYLVIDVSQGAAPENAVFVKDLAADGPVVELVPPGEGRFAYLANDGASFYFLTTKDSPRGRIIAIDLHDRAAREIVPQGDDALDGASFFGDRIVASYLHDALARVVVYGIDGGRLSEVALPGLGSVAGFSGKRSDRETFYSYTSYTDPTSIYRYEVASGLSTRVFTPQIRFDASQFASEQVFYTSKDGTRVPMIVTWKKGTPRDGSAPAILYGYGGFDISLTPAFSSAVLVWLEMGGIYAVANLRGGGEYGQRWHQGGVKANKQNTFDDFVAAAEFLIDQKWTSTPKLAIHGGSNGGLLVGACMTQRPELFGAALPSVGVLDMLRFQRFTIGWAWTSDYGSSDEADDVGILLGYSPYHNVRPGVRYPATL